MTKSKTGHRLSSTLKMLRKLSSSNHFLRLCSGNRTEVPFPFSFLRAHIHVHSVVLYLRGSKKNVITASIRHVVSAVLSDSHMRRDETFRNHAFTSRPVLHHKSRVRDCLPSGVHRVHSVTHSRPDHVHSSRRLFCRRTHFVRSCRSDVRDCSAFGRCFPACRSVNGHSLHHCFS